MRTTIERYELFTSSGNYIGGTPIHDQAAKAARNFCNSLGEKVKVVARKADGTSLEAFYFPDGTIQRYNGEVIKDPNDERNWTVNMTILPGKEFLPYTEEVSK